jgi:hypothetical protein
VVENIKIQPLFGHVNLLQIMADLLIAKKFPSTQGSNRMSRKSMTRNTEKIILSMPLENEIVLALSVLFLPKLSPLLEFSVHACSVSLSKM